MSEISLKYPIHSLEGTELVPAGITLNENFVRKIIASNSNPPAKTMSLMKFGAVKNDIFDFFTTQPYRNIFDNHLLYLQTYADGLCSFHPDGQDAVF
jgi:hypothetical protein